MGAAFAPDPFGLECSLSSLDAKPRRYASADDANTEAARLARALGFSSVRAFGQKYLLRIRHTEEHGGTAHTELWHWEAERGEYVADGPVDLDLSADEADVLGESILELFAIEEGRLFGD